VLDFFWLRKVQRIITIRAAVAYKCIGAFAAALILLGCARPPAPGPGQSRTSPTAPPRPVQERPKVKVITRKVTLRWQEGDKMRLAATAARGTADELTGTGVLEHVSASLYREGKPAAELQAPRVRADRKAAIVLASGGVVLRSIERNTVIRSQMVRWEADKHRIIATGGVRVDSENGRIAADSAIADTELKTIEFRAGASGGSAVIGGKRRSGSL